MVNETNSISVKNVIRSDINPRKQNRDLRIAVQVWSQVAKPIVTRQLAVIGHRSVFCKVGQRLIFSRGSETTSVDGIMLGGQ
jgi:hypothetical protein